MRKQYKLSKIKNKEITFFWGGGGIGVPLKRYVVIFTFGPRNEKQYCGNIQ